MLKSVVVHDMPISQVAALDCMIVRRSRRAYTVAREARADLGVD